MALLRKTSTTSSVVDDLERLAEELAVREERQNGQIQASQQHDLPPWQPLSHDNPHLASAEFSVESFLLSRSYTSLTDLRSELRDYLMLLKEELVQLINDDYEAFISLSTDLRGEGVRLQRLHYPLSGLKKEVLATRAKLQEIEDATKAKLSRRATLRDEKAFLHLLLKLSDSVSRLESLLLITGPESPNPSQEGTPSLQISVRLEHEDEAERSRGTRTEHLLRVASEYMQLLYHLQKAKAEKCAFAEESQWRIDRIKATLSSDLNRLFTKTLLSLTAARSDLPNGKPRNQDIDHLKTVSDLRECLRIYDVLGLWREAEEIIRREVVKDYLDKVVHPGSLALPVTPNVPRTPFQSSLASAPEEFVQTPYTPFTAFRSRQNPFLMDQHISSAGVYLLDDADNPLAALYNKILRWVDQDLSTILRSAEKVTSKHMTPATSLQSILSQNSSTLVPSQTSLSDIQGLDEDGYNIMANVVWAEIGRALMEHMGSTLFSAGNATEFRKNYETTQAFIRSLEFLAPTLYAVQHIRSHPIYEAFLARWQLPVYFQLRWKEIVTAVEEVLEDTKLDSSMVEAQGVSSSKVVMAKQTVCALQAISSCWSADIYIPDLAHRFWKLSLQLINRYRIWMQASLPELTSTATATRQVNLTVPSMEKSPSTSSSISRAATPVPPPETQSVERIAQEDTLLRQCAIAISDIKQFSDRVLNLWDSEIRILLPELPEDESSILVDEALNSVLLRLSDLVPPLFAQVVEILIRRACEALTPVKSIPSQLRAMTNKSAPVRPSQFIPLILKPVRDFFGINAVEGVGRSLRHDSAKQIATQVFEAVASRYVGHLNGMKKMEDSLRRLKKGQRSGFSLFRGAQVNQNDDRDEERIRSQLILDVDTFGRDAESLGVDTQNSDAYKALNYTVHADSTESDGYNVDGK